MSRTFWYGLLVAVLTLVAIERARSADVQPVWQNDTVSNTLSFNDTFGHQVSPGTYNPATGAWIPGGAQSIIVGTSVITGTCPNGQVLTNSSGVVGCTAAGSGTVTSVALTLPSFLTVTGSPITTSGTLAITATSEPQNEVLASPDGASGAMSPRALVAADISGIPGNLASGSSPISGTCPNGDVLYNNAGVMGCVAGSGTGTVTSVSMSVPSFLTITGSPITSAGTLAVTATSEPQNMFLASPNGSTGAMVPRSVTGNDLTSALSSPPAIGSTTASTGAFTTLSASGAVSGVGFSNYLASPPAIGGTAAAAGSFTTLSASGVVSGSGFTTLFANPPAIGSSAASTGAFTTLSASSTVSGAGFTSLFASPPPLGSTAPNTAAATLLTASSSNGGYLTTTIDSRNNNTNGILVSGASTTLAQETTQSSVQINWHPGFTGNPGGTFNTAAITAITTSTINDQIYPWGIIGIVKNYTDFATTGNPNAVAINGTTFTQLVSGSSASSSWGGNFVVDETAAAGITNPTAYRVGVEIDDYMNAADTTDTGIRRIGLLVSCTPKATALTVHCGAGIDISPGAGTLDNALLFYTPNASSGNFVNVIQNAAGSSHYTNFLSSDNFSVNNAGNAVAASLQTPGQTVASLPTCNGGTAGQRRFVTDDLAAVAYRTVVTSGGSNIVPVICASGSWIMD